MARFSFPMCRLNPEGPQIARVYAKQNPDEYTLQRQWSVPAGSLHGKSRADARSHGIPVANTEMADYAQLRTVSGQHICSEARLCAESGVPGVLGTFVVRIPTTASGRSARYVALAMTTAGRTLVSWAPTRTPTTTSPAFNCDPQIPQRRSGAGMRP